jgi:hypothetical protein
MIQFYLTITLVVAAFLYMGLRALKTCDISYEIIDLDKRVDKLEADVLECLKLVKEDMDEIRRTK